ncbi:MAG: hypothetical protein M3R70_09025 [Actinomycetota bacterium]|nr:hypothetical protein [Actinomycetota bacterium]
MKSEAIRLSLAEGRRPAVRAGASDLDLPRAMIARGPQDPEVQSRLRRVLIITRST